MQIPDILSNKFSDDLNWIFVLFCWGNIKLGWEGLKLKFRFTRVKTRRFKQEEEVVRGRSEDSED